jgi:DNA-binding CsgD family transcriptional regulator
MLWMEIAALICFDMMLVSKTQSAVELGLSPRMVETHVRWSATVNTARKRDRLVLRFARISPDPARPKQAFSPQGLKDAVYWVRPFRSGRAVRVVGIIWTDEGEAEVFFGLIYPP